jgi:hypothetical protein
MLSTTLNSKGLNLMEQNQPGLFFKKKPIQICKLLNNIDIFRNNNQIILL